MIHLILLVLMTTTAFKNLKLLDKHIRPFMSFDVRDDVVAKFEMISALQIHTPPIYEAAHLSEYSVVVRKIENKKDDVVIYSFGAQENEPDTVTKMLLKKIHNLSEWTIMRAENVRNNQSRMMVACHKKTKQLIQSTNAAESQFKVPPNIGEYEYTGKISDCIPGRQSKSQEGIPKRKLSVSSKVVDNVEKSKEIVNGYCTYEETAAHANGTMARTLMEVGDFFLTNFPKNDHDASDALKLKLIANGEKGHKISFPEEVSQLKRKRKKRPGDLYFGHYDWYDYPQNN